MDINISSKFENLGSTCAFIPFITIGYPNFEATKSALSILEESNADIIELGIPYSDSLADGPIIQEAAEEAINEGANIYNIISFLESNVPNVNCPIIIFSYYNIILNYGVTNFVNKLSKIGIKGLLIPDLPYEESEVILHLCKQYSIELILLVSPISSPERIAKISDKTQGCLYLVSNTGVTGARETVNDKLSKIVNKISKITSKPIIVGFGVSTTEHVYSIKNIGARGIVVGSALVELLSQQGTDCRLYKFRALCNAISRATKL